LVRRSPALGNTYSWPVPACGAWPTDENAHQVIIVGSGIGGLSAGALLAKRGFKVLVIECHDRPGGYCSCWDRVVDGPNGPLSFHFDAGVQDISGLGPRGPIHQLLLQLEAGHRIDWRRVHHLYVKDGVRFEFGGDATQLVLALAKEFPEEADGIAAFFREIEAVYREMYADIEQTGGVPTPPTSIEAALTWPSRHPHAARWMKQPFAAMLDTFLDSPHLKDILTTLSRYITDAADSLSVADMAPLYGYYFDGGAYPLGGSQVLADLLCAIITEHGGTVRFRTRVNRILVEDGAVRGVQAVNGRMDFAPVVLANGDVVSMMSGLVGSDLLPPAYVRRVDALMRGPSAMLLSLALDIIPDLPARIFVRHEGLEMGVGHPSVIDLSLAPPGHSAITVVHLLPESEVASWGRRLPGYRERKMKLADRLTDALEASIIPDLRRHLVDRQVACPPTFTRFARTINGNIYGAARNQWCPGIMTPVPGLMLAGAGTATGAGIEAVVVCGTVAANLIAPPKVHEEKPLNVDAARS
jgi:phytoene dehydrogenase-like protein